ncbi:MAG TPA: ankyrin repeat domain-containing protein [Thermoanaerobaculia bacterium]|nr:ankyrin repeat domain-containing protein [Thermoanaerobaculia bacterium]
MSEALRIHEAFKAGDLAALKALFEDPSELPNGWIWPLRTYPLEYAIYHGPLALIRTLVDLGADLNRGEETGFPSIIAALSTDRKDRHEIVELLLGAGADIQQRGVNDYTPLHYAATRNDLKGVELLLSKGADPAARTRVDEYTTALQEAERLGYREVAEILRKA